MLGEHPARYLRAGLPSALFRSVSRSPFQRLASAGATYADRPNPWHLTIADLLVEPQSDRVLATGRRLRVHPVREAHGLYKPALRPPSERGAAPSGRRQCFTCLQSRELSQSVEPSIQPYAWMPRWIARPRPRTAIARRISV
jgi:hypothetical protein